MRKANLVFFVLFLTVLAVPAFPQDQSNPADDADCKDSPLVTRMPGSSITTCDFKEFDQFKAPLPNDGEKALEGEVRAWNYATREGTSPLQLFRNFDAALKRAGWAMDNEDSGDGGTAHITAHKASVWVVFYLNPSYYEQTIVTVQGMQQEVAADPSTLTRRRLWDSL